MTFAFAQHAQRLWQVSLRVASVIPLRVRAVAAGVGVDVGIDVGAEDSSVETWARRLGRGDAETWAPERFKQRAEFATPCEVLSRRINQNFAHPACKS
jgi:hypothetical protein